MHVGAGRAARCGGRRWRRRRWRRRRWWGGIWRGCTSAAAVRRASGLRLFGRGWRGGWAAVGSQRRRSRGRGAIKRGSHRRGRRRRSWGRRRRRWPCRRGTWRRRRRNTRKVERVGWKTEEDEMITRSVAGARAQVVPILRSGCPEGRATRSAIDFGLLTMKWTSCSSGSKGRRRPVPSPTARWARWTRRGRPTGW